MIDILLGPPGSGKGAQAAMLASALKVPHVSTAELLRAAFRQGTSLGSEGAPTRAVGRLVPDDLMLRVVARRLLWRDAPRGALLDGFPRSVTRAEAFDTWLTQSRHRIGLVVHLDTRDELLIARLLRRALEQSYADDNLETVGRRIHEYREQTAPLLAYYQRDRVRLLRVDGCGCAEDVSRRIANAVAAIRGPWARLARIG
jgi:adenylate kinase